MFWSYDYVMSVYRAVYVNMQVSVGGSIYDLYKEYNMSEFMNKAYDLIWNLMWSSEGDTEIFDKAQVVDLMESFCNMDIEAQIIFVLYIEGDTGLYYESLFEFLGSYSDNVEDAVTKLLDVEMSAIAYNYYAVLNESGDVTDEELSEALNDLKSDYQIFMTAYDALTEAELTEFSDFDNIYEFYKTLVENTDSTVDANA